MGTAPNYGMTYVTLKRIFTVDKGGFSVQYAAGDTIWVNTYLVNQMVIEGVCQIVQPQPVFGVGSPDV